MTIVPITSPKIARKWVRKVAPMGGDGLKLSSHRPDIMEALIDDAHKQGLRTTAHLGQNGVTRMNALTAARLKLDSLQHWYGLAESMLEGRRAVSPGCSTTTTTTSRTASPARTGSEL